MLESFRNASQKWPVKVLFAVLILGFGSWGVGDVIRQRVAAIPAISVGDREFSAADVADRFHRDVDRMSSMFGSKLTTEQALQFGLLQRTVQELVNGALLDQAAANLHLGVDDETLRKTIAEIPAFRSQLKVFDKSAYLRVLNSMNMTESQFIRLERSDLARGQLVTLIDGGVKAPASLASPLYRHQSEKRIADYIVFAADSMPSPSAPDQATLQKFYEDHKGLFQQPEFRSATALVVHQADLAATIQPSDADIQKAYDARLGEFQTQEKRSIEQILFNDQAQAQAFLDKVKSGVDFDAAAKAMAVSIADLGTITKAEMPLAELADPAFSGAGPDIKGPVQSTLGWHVLRIKTIIAGKTRPLAEVRDQIVAGLVKDEATNRLYSLSTKLEDSIGGGNDVEETAKSIGLKAIKIESVDDHGNDASGKPVAPALLTPAILATIFQTVQGGTSDVVALPNNDGYYVLHVDKVTASLVRPFDGAIPQITAAWQAEQRSAAAKRLADAALLRARQGESLATLASAPFKVETTRPFLRSGTAQVPPVLAAEMFRQAKIGDVTVVVNGRDSMIAQLKDIERPDADGAGFDAARTQLSQSLSDEITEEYVAALKKDIGAQVNMAVINQQFAK